LSKQLGMPEVAITPEVREGLLAYDWPGNVRELRNMVERTLILGRFPQEILRGNVALAGGEGESLEALERRHILKVLEECDGNRAEAARRLGVSRKTIDRKCASWDV
jgi:DNA-binding NtrC family response regulator